MTKNKITKEIATMAFTRIDSKNINIADVILLKKFFKNELDASLRCGESITDTSVTTRNIACFSNMCANLEKKDFTSAWYELQDMLDFHKPEDYLSINEIALVDAALRVFIMSYGEFITSNKATLQ